MKPETFVRWAEGYYGAKYNPVCRAELLRWLAERGEVFTAGVRERVREEYSNQYRLPPDIAILSGFRNQATFDRGYKVLALAEEKRAAVERTETLSIGEGT